jgi:hypothetical protein
LSTTNRGTDHLDGRHDFDFIFGSWNVLNRKLRDMTDPSCQEWIEFNTIAWAEPILDGLGHFDRMWSDADSVDGQWECFILRQFDPADRLWRMWCASTKTAGHVDPPLTGRFTGRVGTFAGDETVAGRLVKVRFEWANPSPGRALWSQAVSFDAGRGWSPNWFMEFTRTSSRRSKSSNRRT